MHRRIRRACMALFDRGCTKIATIGCVSSLDAMIAKATSADDVPLPEQCVWNLAIAFSASPACSWAFGLAFSRRFGRTRCWRVALKCLLLLHRLLRTVPSTHAFRYDILSARANALLSFRSCRFPEDYAAFIHSYAQLVDGVLHAPTPPPSLSGSPGNSNSQEKLKGGLEALELVRQLQGLVDRTMDCVPLSHLAARSFIVRSVMEQVARESFAYYLASRGGLSVVIDGILLLPYTSCAEGLAAYRRAADQALRLEEFYGWCRDMKLCRAYEYPIVEKISYGQIRMLEDFVEKLWLQSTECSSSSSPSVEDEATDKGVEAAKGVVITETWEKFEMESSPSVEDEATDKEVEVAKGVVITKNWEKFEMEDEEKPLIEFEQVVEASWEALLESSML